MLCKQFTPLVSSSDKQCLTNFHPCQAPYNYFEIATLLCFSTLRRYICLVALGCHNKIIAMQPPNFVCPPRNSHFPPFSQQRRVMSLFLCQFADFIRKSESMYEIIKLEYFL